jgi:hypothetical protein
MLALPVTFLGLGRRGDIVHEDVHVCPDVEVTALQGAL